MLISVYAHSVCVCGLSQPLAHCYDFANGTHAHIILTAIFQPNLDYPDPSP